ncbi:unnamed protein product, partial [Staurois parvus]
TIYTVCVCTYVYIYIYIYIYWQKYQNILHLIHLQFQSPPGPQLYKVKHLGIHTASSNICERMGRSQELSEFHCGTMIGCHLCNMAIRDISLLLNIPQSTVSSTITKSGSNWEQQQLSHEVVGHVK